MKKIFCVSAVNLVNGGTLTILKNCLESLCKYALDNDIEIYAIVHKKDICFYPGIKYIEIPWIGIELSLSFLPFRSLCSHTLTPSILSVTYCNILFKLRQYFSYTYIFFHFSAKKYPRLKDGLHVFIQLCKINTTAAYLCLLKRIHILCIYTKSLHFFTKQQQGIFCFL